MNDQPQPAKPLREETLPACGRVGCIRSATEPCEQTTQALRESERRLATLLSNLPGMAYRCRNDAHWTMEFVSQGCLAVTGYTSADLIENRTISYNDCILPEDRALVREAVERGLAEERHFQVEYRIRTAQGAVRWVWEQGVAVPAAGGQSLALEGFITDITQRKEATEALCQANAELERRVAERTEEYRQALETVQKERQTLWHLLQASDHERQLIAYEIHDGLAQYLAAAGMQLQTYMLLREQDPQQAQRAYEAATQLVSQSHFEARRLISGVRPPVLDEAGVETAIAHLVHDERVYKGLKIEFQSEVQFDRLPAILENALYRIAQEALTNAWKHSQSKKVKVALLQHGPRIRLTVQDWGIGFQPDAVSSGHFGLEGIRERVRLLGGTLHIQSTPGAGSLLQIEVPIIERQPDVPA
jgi:PAS domain S-box-containing protein